MTQNENPCREEGCGLPAACKGFCRKHYAAARKAGHPALKTQPECKEEGCAAPSHSRGYCDRHYATARRHGDLEAKTCMIYGCGGAVSAHELCVNHYQKQRRLEKKRAMELEDHLAAEDLTQVKSCENCKEEKPYSEFYRRRSVQGTGRASRCKLCAKAKRLMKSYGVSLEAALALATKTDCASCDDEIPQSKLTAVDHCHKTGHVRDVLCHPCNAALGLLRDDPARIRALAEYAEQWALALRDEPSMLGG